MPLLSLSHLPVSLLLPAYPTLPLPISHSVTHTYKICTVTKKKYNLFNGSLLQFLPHGFVSQCVSFSFPCFCAISPSHIPIARGRANTFSCVCDCVQLVRNVLDPLLEQLTAVSFARIRMRAQICTYAGASLSNHRLS